MTFGAALLIVGGFLLGGSWSIWRSDTRDGRRTTAQVVFAVIVLVCALVATAAGILRLV